MGLLDFLIKRKDVSDIKDTSENNRNLLKSNNIIIKNSSNFLPVHQDILDLIWIIDGPNKNYENKPKFINKFNVDGFTFTFTFSGSTEPSAIYTKLPISKNVNEKVDRPSYYPTYLDLTPDQKSVYWKLLENPYNTEIDIGYVFILYYGLERHLLNGNFNKALDVILKLRDVHLNKSFQTYSGNAIILSCLMQQKPEMVLSFLSSLDKNHEFSFSNNLFLMTYYSFMIPLKASDIMRMAKSFEFENNNYIKKYPEQFEKVLKELLIEKTGKEEILINNFIKSEDQTKLRTEKLRVFSNTSLLDNEINVPLYTDHLKFKKVMYELLEVTHERVKNEIKLLKKNGELNEPAIQRETVKVIEFDQTRENELLSRLKSSRGNLISKHFVLIELQDFYNRFRNLDIKYLNLCIDFCYQDINQLENMQNYYKKQEILQIQKLKSIYSSLEIKEKIEKIEEEGFIGRIPAFERLAIIFEKQGNYKEAIEICEKAIVYSKSLKMNINEYSERRNKLITKLSKANH